MSDDNTRRDFLFQKFPIFLGATVLSVVTAACGGSSSPALSGPSARPAPTPAHPTPTPGQEEELKAIAEMIAKAMPMPASSAYSDQLYLVQAMDLYQQHRGELAPMEFKWLPKTPKNQEPEGQIVVYYYLSPDPIMVRGVDIKDAVHARFRAVAGGINAQQNRIFLMERTEEANAHIVIRGSGKKETDKNLSTLLGSAYPFRGRKMGDEGAFYRDFGDGLLNNAYYSGNQLTTEQIQSILKATKGLGEIVVDPEAAYPYLNKQNLRYNGEELFDATLRQEIMLTLGMRYLLGATSHAGYQNSKYATRIDQLYNDKLFQRRYLGSVMNEPNFNKPFEEALQDQGNERERFHTGSLSDLDMKAIEVLYQRAKAFHLENYPPLPEKSR